MSSMSCYLVTTGRRAGTDKPIYAVWTGRQWIACSDITGKPSNLVMNRAHVYASPARADAALKRGKKNNPHSPLWSKAKFIFLSDSYTFKEWPTL